MPTEPVPVPLPPFQCRIPESLLDKVPDEQREFYKRNDLMDQKMDWLLDHAIHLGSTLEEVRAQTTKTNGSVAQVKLDIEQLRREAAAQAEQTAPVVKAYGVARKLAGSKFFWAGAAALLLIGIPAIVAYAPTPLAVVKAFVSMLTGA